MKIIMPTAVQKIISELTAAGYEAYAVGGCIRDTLMGTVPSDWDICTSALPPDTLRVLDKHNIVENGMKHGTVTIRSYNENYEITTFRSDGDYLDNRHPSNVTFVTNLREDLARRDFTMNAIAYNDTDGLCDEFNGVEDIERKLIRCVGNPDQRFQEDALRIMRALRFSSKLGFVIEPSTAESIHRNAPLLKKISAERLMSELCKLLVGQNVERVLLEYSDVLAVIIPELVPMVGFQQHNPHHIYDVWTHTVKAVSAVQPTRTLRLAALFHDFGKPSEFTLDKKGVGHFHGHPEVSAKMAERILNRLKTDNKTKREVIKLIEMHDVRTIPEPKFVRRAVAKTGEGLYPLLLELKRADTKAQNPKTVPEKLKYIDTLESIFKDEQRKGTAFSIHELNINGNDIKALGVKNGKQIGEILTHLCNAVIDGNLQNNHEELVEEVKKITK